MRRDPGLPERIRDLPNRLKVAFSGEEHEAMVVARKGFAFFALVQKQDEKEPQILSLEEVFRLLDRATDSPRREPSPWFYEVYRELERRLEGEEVGGIRPNSLEGKVLNNLRTALQHHAEAFSEEEKRLLKLLEGDLLYHRWLPRYLLRRLGAYDLGREEGLEPFREVLKEIGRRFGPLLARAGGVVPRVDLLVGVEVQESGS